MQIFHNENFSALERRKPVPWNQPFKRKWTVQLVTLEKRTPYRDSKNEYIVEARHNREGFTWRETIRPDENSTFCQLDLLYFSFFCTPFFYLYIYKVHVISLLLNFYWQQPIKQPDRINWFFNKDRGLFLVSL